MSDPEETLSKLSKHLSKSSEYVVPVRKIVNPKRKLGGDFVQPEDFSAEREVEENKNRIRYASHFNFADPYTGNTRTFDSQGDYNCGRCNQEDDGFCLLLAEPKIDEAAGSCEDWENVCAGDPEMVLHRKSRAAAVYGVAKNGKGFGCHRCGHATRALRPDSRGRDMYCGDGDFRTFGSACCSRNSAPTK